MAHLPLPVIRPQHAWNPKPAGKSPPHLPAEGAGSPTDPCPGGAAHPHARAVQGTVVLDEPVVVAPVCRERRTAVGACPCQITPPLTPRRGRFMQTSRLNLCPRVLELAAGLGSHINPHTTCPGYYREAQSPSSQGKERERSACEPWSAPQTHSSLERAWMQVGYSGTAGCWVSPDPCSWQTFTPAPGQVPAGSRHPGTGWPRWRVATEAALHPEAKPSGSRQAVLPGALGTRRRC